MGYLYLALLQNVKVNLPDVNYIDADSFFLLSLVGISNWDFVTAWSVLIVTLIPNGEKL